MARPQPQRTLVCYHCSHAFAGSAMAVSLNCPGCHKRLTVNDVVINDSQRVRVVQTCGRVLVGKRGALVANSVHACEGMEVLGSVEGRVVSHGPVVIGPKARWKGDLCAPSLEVRAGAVITDGYFQIVPAHGASRESDGSADADGGQHTERGADDRMATVRGRETVARVETRAGGRSGMGLVPTLLRSAWVGT